MVVIEVVRGACATLLNVYTVRVALLAIIQGGQALSLASRSVFRYAFASLYSAVQDFIPRLQYLLGVGRGVGNPDRIAC